MFGDCVANQFLKILVQQFTLIDPFLAPCQSLLQFPLILRPVIAHQL